MNPVRLLAASFTAAAAEALSGPGRGTGHRLRLSQAGAFERDMSVAPGKFAELCGELKPGDAVPWRFTAGHAVGLQVQLMKR